jgi:hypothetical protein
MRIFLNFGIQVILNAALLTKREREDTGWGGIRRLFCIVISFIKNPWPSNIIYIYTQICIEHVLKSGTGRGETKAAVKEGRKTVKNNEIITSVKE